MYVNLNDSHVIHNENLKISMKRCIIDAYPKKEVGNLKVSFTDNNFVKLLKAANVSDNITNTLLEIKDLSDENQKIRQMTLDEFFYFDENDEDKFKDQFMELIVLGELRFEKDFDKIKIEDEYITLRLKEKNKSDFYKSLLFVLDAFVLIYESGLKAIKKADLEKRTKLQNSIWSNSENYIFEDDNILISSEMDFRIKGNMYNQLLLNTQSYVNEYGVYLIDNSYEELKQSQQNRLNLLNRLKNKEHHKFDINTEDGYKEFFKFLHDFSTTFPLYTD